ncbi:MAG: hypothetical protein IPO37_17695 [Saprospiraceae bacterium]|nr:hypothetical protein [Saprospiraceae bacterium]
MMLLWVVLYRNAFKSIDELSALEIKLTVSGLILLATLPTEQIFYQLKPA